MATQPYSFAPTGQSQLFGFGPKLNLSGVAPMPVNPGTTGQEAILSRLNPQLQQQRTSQETQWINQGLRPGGEAYDNAANLLGQQENDARTQAVLQGLNLDTQANAQGFGQALDQGNFGLQGQQLGYQQQADQRAIDAAQHNSTMQGLFSLGGSVGAPLLGKALGIGAAKAAAPAIGQAAGGAAGTAGTAAGTAATGGGGIGGALGLGGGAGLFGLGAATIPVVGGAIAGIALLAKKFFGNGGDRQAANQLTGADGNPNNVHAFFTQATQQIQQLPPEQQAEAADARDREMEQALVAFSKKGKDEYYQAKNTLRQFSGFSSVKPLLG